METVLRKIDLETERERGAEKVEVRKRGVRYRKNVQKEKHREKDGEEKGAREEKSVGGSKKQ